MTGLSEPATVSSKVAVERSVIPFAMMLVLSGESTGYNRVRLEVIPRTERTHNDDVERGEPNQVGWSGGGATVMR
jgi:hypothetical protein